MGTPKGTKRTYMWKSGPDPIDHKLYVQCQRARAQANFRGEVWTITEQEYIDLWRENDRYLNKGRRPEDLCLTRRDPEGDWSMDNVIIVTRAYHYRQIGGMAGTGRIAARQQARELRRYYAGT